MEYEKKIWDTFRYGDESSFRILFDEYYAPLFNYGYKFTTDNFIIEEALQDLFVKLWKNKSSIDKTGSVKNYLYKAFRRVLLRKLEYTPRLHLFAQSDENIPFNIELGHDDVMIRGENLEETRQRLQQALAALSPRQREIIHLRYFEELDYDEIAVIMQLSVSSAYKLLYRALDSLKGQFNTLEWIAVMYVLSLKK
ncbi:MAG: sigma-70 family RNA polymerase sigma factor [Chitinophagaceae bacterium]|nr:sigma-70 family RNA polymerase sigma factor [Chitinophagaceae bacterium]